MKTRKLQLAGGIIRSGLLLSLMILVVQCTGPRGPRGNDGEDGLDGLDGNVYAYSTIYDVDPLDWDGDADGFWIFLDVPEITEDIYYDGAVLVYRLFEQEPKSFNLLPYTYVDNALSIYLDYDAYVGGIDLIYKEVFDGVNDTFAPEVLMSFKILIIEGIPLATVKTLVDIKDYNAVTKTFKPDVDKKILPVF